MAICANCGKEIADGARFCTNCGAPVQSVQAPAQAGPAAPQDSPSQNTYNASDNSSVTGGTGAADSFGSSLEFGTTSGSGSDIYGTTPDSGFGTFENTSGSGSDSFGTASDTDSPAFGTASGSDSFGTASGSDSGLYGTASDSGSAAFGTTTGSGSDFSGTAEDPAGAGHGPAAASYETAPGNGAAYAAGAVVGFTEVPKPSFIEAVATCFKKYATFSGRARRSEYWYFALFIVICQALTAAIGNMIFGAPQDGGNNMLTTIFNLAVLVPQISVFWRRMHDIGKKGTWFFLGLVPVIGWILLLVWECRDSQPGENEYGMSPKYPTA